MDPTALVPCTRAKLGAALPQFLFTISSGEMASSEYLTYYFSLDIKFFKQPVGV